MAFRQLTGPRATFYGENLKIVEPALFSYISKITGNPLQGRVTIFMSQLDSDIWERLAELLPTLGKMVPPDSIAANKQYNDVTLDIATREAEARNKAQAVIDAAVARLEEYQRVQGLQPTDSNTNQITAYIQNYLRGQWTVQTVDEAVRYLTRHGKLTFQKNPPPAATEPVEVLNKLPDGTTQLSLNKPIPGSASAAQARDYLQRLRKQEDPKLVIMPGFKTGL